MKKKIQDILIEHFKEHFGKLIAGMLLKNRIELKGIVDLETLSIQEKIEFGESFIDEIFKKFYDDKKIKVMHTLYRLRLSMNEAIEKIESSIGKDIDVLIGMFDEIEKKAWASNIEKIDDTEKINDAENFYNFCFDISNVLDGTLIISIEKEKVIEFGMLLNEIFHGEKSKDYDLDDSNISAVYDYFNIVLPAFKDVLDKIYNVDIKYVPIYYDKFKQKYSEEKSNNGNSKSVGTKGAIRIYKNEVGLIIDKRKFDAKVLIIVRDINVQLNEINTPKSIDFNEGDNLWELNPPTIFKKSTGDRFGDLTIFFETAKIDPKHIDTILGEIGRDNLNISKPYADLFINKFIELFFENASANKKTTIKTNMAELFNIK